MNRDTDGKQGSKKDWLVLDNALFAWKTVMRIQIPMSRLYSGGYFGTQFQCDKMQKAPARGQMLFIDGKSGCQLGELLFDVPASI